MKNGIILYQSKYGATKQYVDWLSEITGFEYIETKKAVVSQLEFYDTIILCGGIYASGISGVSFLRKNYEKLSHKKLAVFCVGASPYEENAFQTIKQFNLKEDLKEIPIFYGRGAWDEERMTFKDRTLCKMLQKAVAKKDPDTLEPWMKALLSAIGEKCDWTEKEYLKPLINYIEQ